MQSLSLVMSECFLGGRGQGHVNNFYIVDLGRCSSKMQMLRHNKYKLNSQLNI